VTGVRAIAFVLLAACSAPAKPPVVETPPPVGNLVPQIDPYCAILPGLGPWHAEVFPACPPWPLGEGLHVCAPGECPRPCHMHSDIGDDMGTGMWSSNVKYEYDERGRWIRTSSDVEKPDPENVSTCTYDGDRIASCMLNNAPAKAERDGSGRITRVTIGAESVAVTYGANGEVLSVGESTLRYDERGRLAAFTLAGPKVNARWDGEYVLARDASGRVVTETMKREVKTFTYDKDNRVVEAVSRLKPWKLSSEEPPKPPRPDAITTAGARWSDDDICMMCDEGAVDPPPKDPVVERREMLESIEQRAHVQTISYEGANIVISASGEKGPQRRYRHYSYDCAVK
jgi:hypothetical protein